jgi:hypothetical protein
MSDSENQTSRPGDVADNTRRPYEPPGIVWREPYAPVASAVSCVRQPGNPPCNAGPTQA